MALRIQKAPSPDAYCWPSWPNVVNLVYYQHYKLSYMKCTDLQQLRRRGVVREQLQSPLDDVTTGAASLVVFGLLAFAENLDGGKSSDLDTQNTYIASVLWIIALDSVAYWYLIRDSV